MRLITIATNKYVNPSVIKFWYPPSVSQVKSSFRDPKDIYMINCMISNNTMHRQSAHHCLAINF